MDRSFEFDSVMATDKWKFVELTTLRLCETVSEIM